MLSIKTEPYEDTGIIETTPGDRNRRIQDVLMLAQHDGMYAQTVAVVEQLTGWQPHTVAVRVTWTTAYGESLPEYYLVTDEEHDRLNKAAA